MTVSDTDLHERVRNILAERCQINIDFGDNDQVIHLDSMALMEVIVGLENAFDIKIDDSKLEELYRSPSLNSITQLIAN